MGAKDNSMSLSFTTACGIGVVVASSPREQSNWVHHSRLRVVGVKHEIGAKDNTMSLSVTTAFGVDVLVRAIEELSN